MSAAQYLRAFSALMATLAVGAGCFSDDVDPTAPLPADCQALAQAAGVGTGRVVIGIRDFAFVPSDVTVQVGTEVTWVNCEPVGTVGGEHTSTGDLGGWSSPLLARGEIFQQTFTALGDHAYHCTPHPFMQAVVTVE